MIHGRPPQTVCLQNHLISGAAADQRQRRPRKKLAHRVFVLWSMDFVGHGHNPGDAQVLGSGFATRCRLHGLEVRFGDHQECVHVSGRPPTQMFEARFHVGELTLQAITVRGVQATLAAVC
jgi:hypothetical protein